VFERTRGSDRGRYYACLRSRRHPLFLAEAARVGDGIFPTIRLAGPFVGYAYDYCDVDDCVTTVEVADLRVGDFDAEGRLADANPEATADVSALRLKADGAVAWVSCAEPDGPVSGDVSKTCRHAGGETKRLFKWDAGSKSPQLLDKGRMIQAASLRLSGSRLTWTHSGRTRSARLR
jgi:hypothetical protein